MEGAILDDAVLESAYLTKTIDEAKSIKGADFTEAVMPTPTEDPRQVCYSRLRASPWAGSRRRPCAPEPTPPAPTRRRASTRASRSCAREQWPYGGPGLSRIVAGPTRVPCIALAQHSMPERSSALALHKTYTIQKFRCASG
eukprot:scaffold30664_cov72-Phaeocystis_antarctica.AAC.6